MRKSKHLPSFILILTLIGILGAPFSLSELAAQDRIPACPPPGKKQKTIKPLREMNWANDTVSVQFSFPAAFRGMGRNEIVDSIALLTPVFERLRQVRASLSEDTVRMSKSKASSTVHSLVYVGDCSECFYQSGTRSLRIDMSTHMAIADMNNTDRIFRQAGTHLAEPFKYGSQ